MCNDVPICCLLSKLSHNGYNINFTRNYRFKKPYCNRLSIANANEYEYDIDR